MTGCRELLFFRCFDLSDAAPVAAQFGQLLGSTDGGEEDTATGLGAFGV